MSENDVDCGPTQTENECRCGVIKVGGQPTLSRNWNPDCPEHGTASAWYRSPEQVEKRAVDSERLRDLQRRAREARNASRTDHVDTPSDRPTKPIGQKAYGSIPHIVGSRLGPGDYTIHEGQSDICTTNAKGRTVWVQTKLDGSCVSVARLTDGQLVALGRAGFPAITSPHEMHHLFDQWATDNADRFDFLNPGERVVGEWLAQAHGTIYDLDGRDPFVAFDVMAGPTRVTLDEFTERVAGRLSIPDVIRGPVAPQDAMSALWHYGADEPEGVVYRAENGGKVEFLAKWVHADKVDGKYLFGEPVWNWRSA